MSQTPREIMQRTLKFETPERMPREIWALPWAEYNHSEILKQVRERFPADIAYPPNVYNKTAIVKGDEYEIGEYTDSWGCVFRNVQKGIIGEVKKPIVENIKDWKTVQPPYDMLPTDKDKARDIVNRFCGETDLFVVMGGYARPWERYQFIRGTENAMMDIAMPDTGVKELLDMIHSFNMKEMEFWVSTDVDSIFFMDDWGAQKQLLIPPDMWREYFKPKYKDYCDIAHANGKFAMMHSDGQIIEIYEDLIEVGVDALNSQLFCMDMDEISRRFKGRITFWGEIDRQHVLPKGDAACREAVGKVADLLYDTSGGIIAQFEFSPGSDPSAPMAIFEEWEKTDNQRRSC